jgi:large subunit ribosomal protein L23
MSVKPEHYDMIKKPVITEKATLGGESNAVVFPGGEIRDQAR